MRGIGISFARGGYSSGRTNSGPSAFPQDTVSQSSVLGQVTTWRRANNAPMANPNGVEDMFEEQNQALEASVVVLGLACATSFVMLILWIAA